MVYNFKMFRKCLRSLTRFEMSVPPNRLFSMQPPKGYKLVVDNNNVDDTLDFLCMTFFRDEPIIKVMQLEDYGDLTRYYKKYIAGSTAIKMVDNSTCETVALALCSTCDSQAAEHLRSFAECSICDYKTKRLKHFLADVVDSHNLFDCFKVANIWEISILSTAPSVRGKGISKLLVQEAKLQGMKKGLTITRMNCTSHISAKLASSMKFTTFPPRHVLTYRDKRGAPWLPKAPPPPHGHVVVAYDFLT